MNMAPYIRRVSSFKSTMEIGTDEQFYFGSDFAFIPHLMVNDLQRLCSKLGIANASIPIKGAQTDEPQEVYVIPIKTKEGKAELKDFQACVGPLMVKILIEATAYLSPRNILKSEVNQHLDMIESCISYRTLVFRLSDAKRNIKDSDPALIIGI